MEKFFYPRSICIVGASSREKSIGYEILRSIKEYGFKGKVFPVNPKSSEILNYKCYRSITEIKAEIDLAIIVVPKNYVLESIDELAENGVMSIILITAGFKETGQEGGRQERSIIDKLNKYNMRMIGPNCMGLINTNKKIRLNATFVAENPENGGTAFLSQSGALGAAVINSLRETRIKLSQFVSIGNKADVSELDILRFWLADENIEVIAFYLESIEKGLELINIYRENNSSKPLVILKAGKTESGMKAASSHTGAMSSNNRIIDALFKQFGIIRVNTINDMFNTAKGFEYFPIPNGNRIAIVTNAGGPAILAVDKLAERNLVLAEFSDSVKKKLKEVVHPEGSINNPVDLLPGGTPEIFKRVNEIVIGDKNVDAVISIFVEPVMVDAFEVVEKVNTINSEKPVYQVCMPLPEFWSQYGKMSKQIKPVFRNPEDPAEIISNVLLYKNRKKHEYHLNVSKNINIQQKKHTEFLNQKDVFDLCRRYNLPLVEQKLLNREEIKNGENINYPIVLKGVSSKAVHKSELDLVKLNIQNSTELKKAVSDIENSLRNCKLPLEKFLVQPFIKIRHELLIGALRDESFGPVVIFGSGGKYVEVYEDISIKSAFLNDFDIDDMINETRIGKIIKGIRGEPGINIEELGRVIKSVAKLILENESIVELDVNPLAVDYENKLNGVDIRIKVKNR